MLKLAAHLSAFFCTQRLRLRFFTVCIMCVNKLLNYLIIYCRISWDLFGLFFVNILFSVVCFSLGVWSAIFQILSSIFLKSMKCYLLLLYSTQKPYRYIMVSYLTMLNLGTRMRPNSVFSLAVVGSLLHSLTVFVLFFCFIWSQAKIYLKLSKKKKHKKV